MIFYSGNESFKWRALSSEGLEIPWLRDRPVNLGLDHDAAAREQPIWNDVSFGEVHRPGGHAKGFVWRDAFAVDAADDVLVQVDETLDNTNGRDVVAVDPHDVCRAIVQSEFGHGVPGERYDGVALVDENKADAVRHGSHADGGDSGGGVRLPGAPGWNADCNLHWMVKLVVHNDILLSIPIAMRRAHLIRRLSTRCDIVKNSSRLLTIA